MAAYRIAVDAGQDTTQRLHPRLSHKTKTMMTPPLELNLVPDGPHKRSAICPRPTPYELNNEKLANREKRKLRSNKCVQVGCVHRGRQVVQSTGPSIDLGAIPVEVSNPWLNLVSSSRAILRMRQPMTTAKHNTTICVLFHKAAKQKRHIPNKRVFISSLPAPPTKTKTATKPHRASMHNHRRHFTYIHPHHGPKTWLEEQTKPSDK